MRADTTTGGPDAVAPPDNDDELVGTIFHSLFSDDSCWSDKTANCDAVSGNMSVNGGDGVALDPLLVDPAVRRTS